MGQDRRKRREIANNQFVQPHHVREKRFVACVSNADPLCRRGLDSTPPGAWMTRGTGYGWLSTPADPAPCSAPLRPGEICVAIK